MKTVRIFLASFALTIAAIVFAAPVAANRADAWREWTDRARSILVADQYGATDDDAEPAAFVAACAAVRRPISGGARLPGWTSALQPYCRTVYLMKTRSELPIPLWRATCRDARRAVALLEQARPVAVAPRAEPVARALVGQWRKEYAASCPAVIPPQGYPA